MQARRASRELALILFSQLDKDVEKYNGTDFEQIVLNSVRTLISSTSEELSILTSDLAAIKEYIEESEADDPENLERPFEVENLPVPMPLTSDMLGRTNTLLMAADRSINALEVAELCVLSSHNDVKRYIEKILKKFKEFHNEVDSIIKEYASGWDIERLFKIDKDILRIAITELVHVKDAPVKVVIDEAIELAKKYSTDESPAFINGILAKVVAHKI